MVEVTTKTGKVHKMVGFDWEVGANGLLVVRNNKVDGGPFKTVFADGAWESIREYSE